VGSVYKLTKDSRFWWVAYRGVDGKRYAESSRSERKSDAVKLLRFREGSVVRGEPVTPRMGRVRLGPALKSVVDDMKANGRRSVADTQRIITLHLLPYFGTERRLATIGAADIKAYVTHRLQQDAAAATVNNECAWLRRAFRLAMEMGDVLTVPRFRLLKENNTRRGFFEHAEFEAVRERLPQWLQPVVRFAYITGWRVPSEVLTLTANQVDLDAGVVRLEVGTTKNGEGRQFIVTSDLKLMLEEQLASIERLKTQGVITPYVFHRPDGTRIKDLRGRWATACKDAGVPGRLLHDFRRTAVRNLERAGVPRSVAMSMVGHKTEAIYRRYAIVDHKMQQEAAQKLNAFAELQAIQRTAAKGRVAQFTSGA
jgi:integrase